MSEKTSGNELLLLTVNMIVLGAKGSGGLNVYSTCNLSALIGPGDTCAVPVGVFAVIVEFVTCF